MILGNYVLKCWYNFLMVLLSFHPDGVGWISFSFGVISSLQGWVDINKKPHQLVRFFVGATGVEPVTLCL